MPTAGTTLLPPARPDAIRISALPRTGVILIGTRRSAERLADLLAMLPASGSGSAPIVAGTIAIDTISPAAFGSLEDLPILVPRHRLNLALVSLPESMAAERRRIAAALDHADLKARWIPTLEDLFAGAFDPGADTPKHSHALATALPSIDLAELIGRRPYEMDRAAIARILTGKRILITGAGGSIGSELARVAAGFDPELLILMERAENALFEIDRQIARQFPRIPRKAIMHDVVDAEETLRLAMALRPHAVFHAAAHKHVPLMEDHPSHAVTNNLFGTKSIADAAVASGAERFVMISSDKAVNPTSVMGATKRLAELYVHGLGPHAADSGTRLSMVRFGNVLGSAASVLTIWGQQLVEGGPITITDPRMTRYFMTIPEAATLVVQSATLEDGGIEGAKDRGIKAQASVGVFVLDMGEPIRIAELAARFVRAHGLTPRVRSSTPIPADLARIFPEPPTGGGGPGSAPAIDITFTGARPGEKLHEELAYAAEGLRPTAHPGVRAWGGPGFESERAARVRELVADLSAARFSKDRYTVLAAIRKHVPEMRPADPPVGATIHPMLG